MIRIIDYGAGNPSSIKNMLHRLGVDSVITADASIIASANKLILPGVGSFDHGMQQLHSSGLVSVLNEKVIQQKTPILGICLGVQLFTESSQEGREAGLCWIKGKTISFDKSRLEPTQRIPHMGWNEVSGYSQSMLFNNMYEKPRFYFVHSYHLQISDSDDEMVKSKYGYEFCAGVERENILGVQFHPEKSHKFGMKLLENFAKYY